MTTSLKAALPISKTLVKKATLITTGIKTVSGGSQVGDSYVAVTENSDAWWNSVVLALDFEDGISDISNSNHEVTTPNGYVLDSDTVKYGVQSLYLNGVNQYLVLPNQPEFELKGGKGWVIECWINPAEEYIPAIWSGGGVDEVYLSDSQGNRAIFGNKFFSGTDGFPLAIANQALNSGVWSHIALAVTESSSRLYVNGVIVLSTSSTNTTISTIGIQLGYNYLTIQPFYGYVDDVRITKGTARYYGTNISTPLTITNSNAVKGDLWTYTETGSTFGYNNQGTYRGVLGTTQRLLGSVVDSLYLPGKKTRMVTSYSNTKLNYESALHFLPTNKMLKLVVSEYIFSLGPVTTITPIIAPDDQIHKFDWVLISGPPITWRSPYNYMSVTFEKSDQNAVYVLRLYLNRGTIHEQYFDVEVNPQAWDTFISTALISQSTIATPSVGTGIQNLGLKPGISPPGTATYNNTDIQLIWTIPVENYPIIYQGLEIYKYVGNNLELLDTLSSVSVTYSNPELNQPNFTDVYLFRSLYSVYRSGLFSSFIDLKTSFTGSGSNLDGTDELNLSTLRFKNAVAVVNSTRFIIISQQSIQDSFAPTNPVVIKDGMVDVVQERYLTLSEVDYVDTITFSRLNTLNSNVLIAAIRSGSGIVQEFIQI